MKTQQQPQRTASTSSSILNGSLLEQPESINEEVNATLPSRMDVVLEAETVHYRPMFSHRARTDTIKEKITLTMSRLISWSEQVANGMDYLSSKNVVHGDLACRYVIMYCSAFIHYTSPEAFRRVHLRLMKVFIGLENQLKDP